MTDEQEDGFGERRTNSGRPRDDHLDARVLDATRASLAEVGWERTSIRGVAERSGVSRPAIARRWPSKAHLALESILAATPDLAAFEGVDRAGWVDAVIAGSLGFFDRDDVHAAAPGLLATLRDHDDIREALWDGFSGPASALIEQPLAASAPNGHDPGPGVHPSPDLLVDAQAAIVLAAGAALFLSLVAGNDARVRDRVTTALTASLTEIIAS